MRGGGTLILHPRLPSSALARNTQHRLAQSETQHRAEREGYVATAGKAGLKDSWGVYGSWSLPIRAALCERRERGWLLKQERGEFRRFITLLQPGRRGDREGESQRGRDSGKGGGHGRAEQDSIHGREDQGKPPRFAAAVGTQLDVQLAGAVRVGLN